MRKQQKVLDEKIKEAGSSEIRKEKVEKSMTQDKFLDILKNADNKPEQVVVKFNLSLKLSCTRGLPVSELHSLSVCPTVKLWTFSPEPFS